MTNKSWINGCGGVQVVSVQAFYSDGPSSNPAFSVNLCAKKNENKQKEAGVGKFLKTCFELLAPGLKSIKNQRDQKKIAKCL